MSAIKNPRSNAPATSESRRGHPVLRARPLALALAVVMAAAGIGLTATPAVAAEPCVPSALNGALFITETCGDPSFNQPFIDVDEQRSTTDPASSVSIAYRYVHGGFSGTNARFSLYFPSSEDYSGRFFQSTYPTVPHEDADPTALVSSLAQGAYVVQTNNGGGAGGYRINAAAANYSRHVAAEVYGTSERPRGYIYGLSGGGYQTIAAAENSESVWDGAVPIVLGTPNSTPSFATAQVLALRVLGDKLAHIADAMEPGGSGDPYEGLTTEQRRILKEVTQLGLPLEAWWEYKTLAGGSIANVSPVIRQVDESYVNDFWTKPGYAGTDPAESAASARIQAAVSVVSLIGSPASQLELSNVPTGYLKGAEIVVTSGAAQNQRIPLGEINGNAVGFGAGANAAVTDLIKPGDQIRIDNSWALAVQYYHRYQVPSEDMYGWNQYRNADGSTMYPQRPFLLGPLLANYSGGAVATGNIHGKMIAISALRDVEAFAWPADWYRNKVSEALGANTDDNFRLWYLESSGHYTPRTAIAQTHNINYDGAVLQALLSLDTWVTTGNVPAANSNYTITDDNQVSLPATATERAGIQPVLSLTANTSESRTDVVVGQRVNLAVSIDIPADGGEVSTVEWDFEGLGNFEEGGATTSYVYARPGTYFPVVRVSTQQKVNADSPFGQVQNLDSVRVVVSEDVEAPVVRGELDRASASGWYRDDVQVSLLATDNSGEAKISYTLSGATAGSVDTIMGTANLRIENDGATAVEYSASDPSGNASVAETLHIKIDRAAPTVVGTGEPSAKTITLIAQDNLSGLSTFEFAVIDRSGDTPARWTRYSGPIAAQTVNTIVAYRAIDVAGNVASGEYNYADSIDDVLEVKPGAASRGDTMKVTGEHLAQGMYQLKLNDENVGTARASADGRLIAKFVVPATTGTGAGLVTAISAAGASVSAPISITERSRTTLTLPAYVASSSQSISATAKVTANNRPIAGLVQLWVDGKKFGSAQTLSHEGTAQLNISKLGRGLHWIQVSYLGSGFVAPSESVGRPLLAL